MTKPRGVEQRLGKALYEAIHSKSPGRVWTFVVMQDENNPGPNEYSPHGTYEVDVRWVPCPCDVCQERWHCAWNKKHDQGDVCNCESYR